MKTMSKFLSAAFVLMFANNAFGQATTQGTATATIVEPIAISNTRDLAFGSIAKGTNGGTVTLTAAQTTVRSKTSDVTLVASTYSSATFNVTGDAGRDFFITLPADGVVTISTTANGGDDMSVDGFTSSTSTTSSQLSAPANSLTGALTFYVGATLSVKGTQKPGGYTGDFDVTVNYL